MRAGTPYDDEYPTCVKTFVWLRVMGETLEPDVVTAALGIEPTRTQFKGTVGLHSALKRPMKYSGWFLQSDEQVSSRDARRHFDWLLNQLQGKQNVLARLREDGNLVDICCRWDSAGHGGPTLNPEHLNQLGTLGVELWFDVYFAEEDSDT